jgi:hypothetical protein
MENKIQFKYKPTGQWIIFSGHRWVLSNEPDSEDNIYEYINEIISDLKCSFDDIEVIGYKMESDEADDLLTQIRSEGSFDYTFEHYSNFENIKDSRFHELRLDYLRAKKELEDYIKWCSNERE